MGKIDGYGKIIFLLCFLCFIFQCEVDFKVFYEDIRMLGLWFIREDVIGSCCFLFVLFVVDYSKWFKVLRLQIFREFDDSFDVLFFKNLYLYYKLNFVLNFREDINFLEFVYFNFFVYV